MIEWDEVKSQATYEARGFDFALAARIFDGDTLEGEDQRRDYGEQRIRAIGQVDDLVLVVVYTWRGRSRRLISARRANRREREEYLGAYRALEG